MSRDTAREERKQDKRKKETIKNKEANKIRERRK